MLLLLSRISCVRLLATQWTVAYQAPPSMGFPRQEYWSQLLLPSPILYSIGKYSHYFVRNFKWSIIVKSTESLCCTPETNIIL